METLKKLFAFVLANPNLIIESTKNKIAFKLDGKVVAINRLPQIDNNHKLHVTVDNRIMWGESWEYLNERDVDVITKFFADAKEAHFDYEFANGDEVKKWFDEKFVVKEKKSENVTKNKENK